MSMSDATTQEMATTIASLEADLDQVYQGIEGLSHFVAALFVKVAGQKDPSSWSDTVDRLVAETCLEKFSEQDEYARGLLIQHGKGVRILCGLDTPS
jgi:hypothetical protein